jgi:hypothetical protein
MTNANQTAVNSKHNVTCFCSMFQGYSDVSSGEWNQYMLALSQQQKLPKTIFIKEKLNAS